MFWKKILTFIILHVVILGFHTKVSIAPTASTTPIASSTVQVMATSTKPTASTTPAIKPQQPAAQKATTTPKVKPLSATPITPPATSTPVATSTQPTPDFASINTFARSAIVNILCTTKGGELSPISATGVVVSSEGLILTNAHVAQYFLLKDYSEKDFITCVARTGSPAYPRYNLELVYISPTWVENNKDLLKEQEELGTGENDFAFLRITNAIDGSPLPQNFPFLPMDVREVIQVGEPTLLAAYPAGFLGGLSILQDLSITTAITQVSDLFTFKSGTIDLISVPGTVVSQKGSSGGAVVDKYATLLGIISTSSDGNTTSQRDLRAITLGYINRDLQAELGMSLGEFANQNMADFAQKFQTINAPALTKLITDELNN